MKQKQELALFDLDHTLLQGDSDFQWTDFLIEQGVLEGESFQQGRDKFQQQYHAGKLDIREYLAFQLAPLAKYPMELLQEWRESYIFERVVPMVTPAARALTASALLRGALVAVVTATNRFITEPIPALFGIQHLVATTPQLVNGRYTGAVDGTPCFQEGKITCTTQWLASINHKWSDFDIISCYSDSHNDLPLLRRATRAVAVNPDPILTVESNKNGWATLHMQVPRDR